MKRYWIGTMNRILMTIDKEMPASEGWREVTEKQYNEAYLKTWDIACNTAWHC